MKAGVKRKLMVSTVEAGQSDFAACARARRSPCPECRESPTGRREIDDHLRSRQASAVVTLIARGTVTGGQGLISPHMRRRIAHERLIRRAVRRPTMPWPNKTRSGGAMPGSVSAMARRWRRRESKRFTSRARSSSNRDHPVDGRRDQAAKTGAPNSAAAILISACAGDKRPGALDVAAANRCRPKPRAHGFIAGHKADIPFQETGA